MLSQSSKTTEIKQKKTTNGLNQTYKFYTVKTINKMTTCGLGKNICKGCDWQGLNFQNIQNSSVT